MENKLAKGYVDRAPRMEDTEALVEMFNAASQKLLGIEQVTVEEQRIEFEVPGRSLEDDFRVVVAPDGKMAGYIEVFGLSEPYTPLYCWGRVHPEHQGRGVGSYLMEWAEGRARKALPLSAPELRVPFWAFCNTIDAHAQTLFTEQGFKLLRHNLRMVIELNGPPPEPEWPVRITVRTVVPGQDEFPAFVAGREAFEDHWGHVVRPLEEEFKSWQHRVVNNPDYEPGLWFLALDGSQIAGSSMNFKRVDNDPSFGWVASLSVRRPWRKQGLGLALLQQSIGEFYRRGYRKVGLGVDAENLTGAVRLYEKAGMHSDPQHQMTIFEKELRPGKEAIVNGCAG
jgi:mycothiol synthase